MKISLNNQRTQGSAVLIVLILLGLMLAILASNTSAINQLKREISLVEQQQAKRYSAQNNAPAEKESK